MKTEKYKCAIEVTLDAIGGKCKCIILYYLLKHETLRFGEILRIAKGASNKMIAQQLSQLEAHQLIEKQVQIKQCHALMTASEQNMKKIGTMHLNRQENRDKLPVSVL